MAEASTQKFSFLPKLKILAIGAFVRLRPRWEQLNQQTQVELKIFVPVFSATLAFLLLIVLLIPSYRPGAVKHGASDTSSRLIIGASDIPKPAANPAPAPNRVFTDREKQAIAVNDAQTHDALIPAPVEALEEGSGSLRLPKVAEDGRRPWFVYSRPFDHVDPRPRIAVVVADLGLNRLVSESAINDLPPSVTLTFESDAHSGEWMARARSLGHEVLLSVPMEPLDYPANDPGPGTLLSSHPPEDNKKRLEAAMAKSTGYVGLTTLTGSRFTSSPDQLHPVLKEIMDRGLLWLDARLEPLSSAYAVAQELHMPAVRTDFRITPDKSRDAMNAIFQDAETSARHAGIATVLVYPSPMSLQAISDWTKTLPEKGLALAPITAMVE